MTEIVLPSHADTRGFAFGGVVLEWIDLAAGYSAKKHAVYPCVKCIALNKSRFFLHSIK